MKYVFFRVIAIIGGLGVALAGAVLLLPLVVPEPGLCQHSNEDPWRALVAMVPVPYTGAHYCPNIRSASVNTNDLGYRGTVNFEDQVREAHAFKADGGAIVIFTGGSAAFGTGSTSDENAIAGQLNRLLSAQDLPIRVYNFGMGFYTAATENAAIIHYAADLDPDLIVIMDGYNDMMRMTHPTWPQSVKENYFSRYVRDLYPLRYESELLDQDVSLEDTDEVVLNFKTNLDRLAAFGLGMDMSLILSIQPVSSFENNCQAPEVDGYQYVQEMLPVYPEAVAASREVADSNPNVTFAVVHDAFKAWPDGCSAFVDNVHMSDSGQLEVARLLVPEIVASLQLQTTER